MFSKNKKTKSPSLNLGKICSIIGEDFELEGNIKSEGTIRIDGKVVGDLRIKKGIILGEKGTVYGNIEAELAVIFGQIHGNINTTQLEIKETGSIYGDIKTNSITMQLGAKYNGKLEMKNQEVPEKPQVTKKTTEEISNGVKLKYLQILLF
jgi:cytoskeletal protein CcmA (bactofilin family)